MFAIERYEKPESAAEAVELLARTGPGGKARPMAGGTDILVELRKNMVPAHVVDIAALPELQVEGRGPDGVLRLGAGLTFSRLIASPLIQAHVPMLAEAADSVAGPQIRNMGTLGGNICNGAVSADSAAPLLALDTVLRLLGPDGERTLPLRDFYLGPGRVALRPAELLLEVHIAADCWQGVGGAWHKYAMRQAMDIATIGCAACAKLSGEGDARLEWLKLAFSVSGPTPLRCPTAESAAKGRSLAGTDREALLRDVAEAVKADLQPRTSWRADKDFRAHIVRTLAARVSALAIERARIGSGRTS